MPKLARSDKLMGGNFWWARLKGFNCTQDLVVIEKLVSGGGNTKVVPGQAFPVTCVNALNLLAVTKANKP